MTVLGTTNTYTPVQADVGLVLTVTITYLDDQGGNESPSASTAAVANTNDTGIVIISGAVIQGQPLSASYSDADGTTTSSPLYQWKRNNGSITGATAIDYTLTQDDVLKEITVTISYTDDLGQFESVTSDPTVAVDNINDVPVITGAVENQAVDDTATIAPFVGVNITDADGEDVSVTITLDDTAKGTFTAASLTVSGFVATAPGPFVLSSTTAANAQNSVRQLVFAPADNRVDVNQTEATNFTIAVEDAIAITNNATTSVVSKSINQSGLITLPTVVSQGDNLIATVVDSDGVPGLISYLWEADGSTVGNNSSIIM